MARFRSVDSARSPRRHNPNHPLTMEIEKATCAVCGYEMEAVRPGKHQCNHCESVEFLERRWRESAQLAGELIACIRINTMRGSFAEATIEQVEEWLIPWVAKLKEVSPKPLTCPSNAEQSRDDGKNLTP